MNSKLKFFAVVAGLSAGSVIVGVGVLQRAQPVVPEAQAASTGSQTIDSNLFVQLSKKVVPSVVNISTFKRVRGGGRGYGGPGAGQDMDLFRRFFEDMFRGQGGPRGRMPGRPMPDDEGGEEPSEQEEGPPPPKGAPTRALALGTGFIIDTSGIILTNNHVVGEADEIQIRFTEDDGEKPTNGEVIGRDPELDLALIKVKTDRSLSALPFGDSDALEVGEYVVAVGNPFGQGHSVTHGIISAKGRLAPELPFTRYLQTDAPINPGNSGGPLVNLKGEVIGINNAIDQRAQNIGFAIPINSVKSVLPQLKSKGVVARGYIGVTIDELNADIAEKLGAPKDLRAPFVQQVSPGEPADKAGVKNYDVITEFNGKKTFSGPDLIASVSSVPVGESVSMKVLRSGKEISLKVKVAARPGVPTLAKKGAEKGKRKSQPPIEVGMQLEDTTPVLARDYGLPEKTTGPLVTWVESGSQADEAGILRGDLILEVDRKAVKSVDEFFKLVREKKSYLLRVKRYEPQGGEKYAVILLDLK